MEMTDRELLELAAKAAGMKLGKPLVPGSCLPHLIAGFNLAEDDRLVQKAWNPLTDDGDALRLAVKLEFIIDIGPGMVKVTYPPYQALYEMSEPDKAVSTRRAIVRAAAEIGKAIP
jgi:hypothetical protein